MPEAPGEAPGEHGDRDHRQRTGRDRQPGARLAVVPYVAHVEEEGEEHHRERDAERQRGRVRPRCRSGGGTAPGRPAARARCAPRRRTPRARSRRCRQSARSCARVQLGESASTMASAIAPTATTSSAMPTPSTRRRVSPRSDSRSRDAPHHSDIAPIGRLMKKAHGQPTVCDDEGAEARPDGGREAAHRAPQADGHARDGSAETPPARSTATPG